MFVRALAEFGVGLVQDLCNLGSRELRRQLGGIAKHASDSGSRKMKMVLGSMWAGSSRGNLFATLAVEGMLELEHLDAERGRVYYVEDLLRRVGLVEVAYAGVIASNDKVGAAVILPGDRVQHSLSRPRVPHRRRIDP